MVEQDEVESTEHLLELNKDSITLLADADIDQRLELVNVKLEQNDLVTKDSQNLAQSTDASASDENMVLRDIEPSSDGDFMSSVMDRAEQQRERDEKKKELENTKELL